MSYLYCYNNGMKLWFIFLYLLLLLWRTFVLRSKRNTSLSWLFNHNYSTNKENSLNVWGNSNLSVHNCYQTHHVLKKALKSSFCWFFYWLWYANSCHLITQIFNICNKLLSMFSFYQSYCSKLILQILYVGSIACLILIFQYSPSICDNCT